jgi:hypothetical protein
MKLLAGYPKGINPTATKSRSCGGGNEDEFGTPAVPNGSDMIGIGPFAGIFEGLNERAAAL